MERTEKFQCFRCREIVKQVKNLVTFEPGRGSPFTEEYCKECYEITKHAGSHHSWLMSTS